MRSRQSRYNPEKREKHLANKRDPKRTLSYRATVLTAIEGSSQWMTAHQLVEQTNLTYPQVIFALFALHNNEKIARIGRKFTARWGSLALGTPPDNNFQLLERLFNGIVKR